MVHISNSKEHPNCIGGRDTYLYGWNWSIASEIAIEMEVPLILGSLAAVEEFRKQKSECGSRILFQICIVLSAVAG